MRQNYSAKRAPTFAVTVCVCRQFDLFWSLYVAQFIFTTKSQQIPANWCARDVRLYCVSRRFELNFGFSWCRHFSIVCKLYRVVTGNGAWQINSFHLALRVWAQTIIVPEVQMYAHSQSRGQRKNVLRQSCSEITWNQCFASRFYYEYMFKG